MRNSSLLKWASNNKKANKDEKGSNDKNWLHSPETLKNGHVVYLVKFLGSTEVDKPKGIEVVKQGIQKLKFNQQLKKSEGQSKTPKVELTISVEGVAIQEPKTKKIMHQYPLHKISYCADDKAEKRFFSFISKEGDSEKHICFVFVSDKLAEEITLTIGQAFDLAYKKFLDTNGKDLEVQKQLMTLQKRVALLENENSVFKNRLKDLSKLKESKDYMASNNISDLCHVEQKASSSDEAKDTDPKKEKDTLINLDENGEIDGFTLDDINDDYFNPRAGSSSEEDEFNPRAEAPSPAPLAVLSPPPALPPRDGNKISAAVKPSQPVNSLFSAPIEPTNNPFANALTATSNMDPFGMSTFDTGAKQTVGFTDSWATAAPTPAATIMSFDDLDPFKK